MSITLALDHPTLTLKNKIQEISNNFLNTFGFNYFQYLRCYSDGSIGLLTNQTGLVEYFSTMENTQMVFSSFKESHENTFSYWFLWDEELPEAPRQLVREKFGIYSGITLVRRTKHYYDMIAVALPKEQPNPGSFYLNKIKAIEQYILTFDKDNKDLIQTMHKNPIALPEPCRDSNYKSICLNTTKITVQGKYGKITITPQEWGCLKFLCEGSTYKEIAHILEISPRTVETYLQRLKHKSGYFSRTELDHFYLLNNSHCP